MEGNRILFGSIGIGLSYWFIDSAVDAYVFREGIFVSQLIAPGMKEIWVRLFAMFVLIASGAFAQRTLNKRIKLERALREEKNRIEAIIGAIGEGVSIQGTNYKILYQNPLHKEIAGDHAGEYCYKAYKDRDSVCPDCHLAMSFADGKIHKKEEVRVSREGIVYYEITASPMKDSEGRIIAGVEAFRDNTERKRIEEVLRDSEERFRKVFENGPIGMVMAGPDFRILRANSSVCQMLGYTEQELAGKSLETFTCPEDRQKAAELLGQLMRGQIPLVRLEKRCVKKDGEVLWTNLTTTTLRNRRGEVVYVLCMIEDISKRKFAEEEREELIRELRDAMTRVKTLSGLLPMCAWCRKVRDDKGYWKKVEAYIEEHSDASFTHGICPECLKKYDPETYKSYQGKRREVYAEERRQCTRRTVTEPFNFSCSLHVRESKDLDLNASVTDISDAGAGIKTDYPLQRNALLAFEFGTENRTGIVRWGKSADAEAPAFRAGIEFIAN
ncbi:MAG: PAS domain S-box protein [Nitrospirota bacterium]|nr:PAS domain S-box protein [Nitrospirota bacterium]